MGTSQARNHHKVVVVDDISVTGSMNFSKNAVSRNHENTLVIDDSRIADQAARFLRSEVETLESLGVATECE